MIQEGGLSGIVSILMEDDMRMMKGKLKDGWLSVVQRGDLETLFIIRFINLD